MGGGRWDLWPSMEFPQRPLTIASRYVIIIKISHMNTEVFPKPRGVPALRLRIAPILALSICVCAGASLVFAQDGPVVTPAEGQVANPTVVNLNQSFLNILNPQVRQRITDHVNNITRRFPDIRNLLPVFRNDRHLVGQIPARTLGAEFHPIQAPRAFSRAGVLPGRGLILEDGIPDRSLPDRILDQAPLHDAVGPQTAARSTLERTVERIKKIEETHGSAAIAALGRRDEFDPMQAHLVRMYTAADPLPGAFSNQPVPVEEGGVVSPGKQIASLADASNPGAAALYLSQLRGAARNGPAQALQEAPDRAARIRKDAAPTAVTQVLALVLEVERAASNKNPALAREAIKGAVDRVRRWDEVFDTSMAPQVETLAFRIMETAEAKSVVLVPEVTVGIDGSGERPRIAVDYNRLEPLQVGIEDVSAAFSVNMALPGAAQTDMATDELGGMLLGQVGPIGERFSESEDGRIGGFLPTFRRRVREGRGSFVSFMYAGLNSFRVAKDGARGLLSRFWFRLLRLLGVEQPAGAAGHGVFSITWGGAVAAWNQLANLLSLPSPGSQAYAGAHP